MKTDIEYRSDLLFAGVRSEIIDPLSGEALDRVGNIVGCYRTSMQEQDPVAYRIRQFSEARALSSDAVQSPTLRDYFAAHALSGLIAAVPGAQRITWVAEAYAIADDILKYRDRK